MRYVKTTIAVIMLVLSLCTAAFAMSDRSGKWQVTIKYGDSMVGQGETESGEDCAFIWEFSEGRKGVRFLGHEATVNLNDIWNSPSETMPMTRVGDRQRADSRPEVVVLLSINVDPADGDDLHVRIAVTRWGLVAEPPPYDYRFETEVLESELGIGDSWKFLGGRGPDGKEYFLEMIIEPAGGSTGAAVKVRPRTAPIRFTYIMTDPKEGSTPVFQTVREIELSDRGEVERVEIQAPVVIRGIDSSVIDIGLKMTEINLRPVGDLDACEIDAIFSLDRMLVVNIIPTDDTTMIHASHLVNSSYSHAVHLKPYKKVRIEIPPIESDDYEVNRREVIEIEAIDSATDPQ